MDEITADLEYVQSFGFDVVPRYGAWVAIDNDDSCSNPILIAGDNPFALLGRLREYVNELAYG